MNIAKNNNVKSGYRYSICLGIHIDQRRSARVGHMYACMGLCSVVSKWEIIIYFNAIENNLLKAYATAGVIPGSHSTIQTSVIVSCLFRFLLIDEPHWATTKTASATSANVHKAALRGVHVAWIAIRIKVRKFAEMTGILAIEQ